MTVKRVLTKRAHAKNFSNSRNHLLCALLCIRLKCPSKAPICPKFQFSWHGSIKYTICNENSNLGQNKASYIQKSPFCIFLSNVCLITSLITFRFFGKKKNARNRINKPFLSIFTSRRDKIRTSRKYLFFRLK